MNILKHKFQSSLNGSVLVKIISCQRDGSGELIGTKNEIPILDTPIYNVQFPDGHHEQYSRNVLVESLSFSVDHDGYDKQSILEICGYRTNSNAISCSHSFHTSSNGNQIPVVTTKGWEVRICWNGNSTTWVPLRLVKNDAPLLLVQYAKTMKIHLKPAFHWWLPHTLHQGSRLLSKVKTLFH